MEEAEYHRTFLPWRPSVPAGPPPCRRNTCHEVNREWDRRIPRFDSPKLHGPLFARHGSAVLGARQPILGRGESPAPPDARRFNAYQMAEGDRLPIVIEEKPDQFFWDYATPFEAAYSNLIPSDSNRPMAPVVDEKFTVVGHLGTVTGREIVVPEEVPPPEGCFVYYLNELVRQEVPVFVLGFRPELDPDSRLGVVTDPSVPGYQRPLPESSVTVLTAIDGRVLACLGESAPGLEDANWIFDVLDVAWGVAKIGVGAGKRMARSLWRKIAARKAQREFGGAINAIADWRKWRRAMWDRLRAKRTRNHVPSSGMTAEHFALFQLKAREQHVFALVRNTNLRSTAGIAKGCPGKPKTLEFLHTHSQTGIVTITTPAEAEKVFDLGYYIVRSDGVPFRRVLRNGKQVVEELHLKPGEARLWTARDQVIDPVTRKPFVGDYDLMDVFAPAKRRFNAAVVARNGQPVKNITTEEVEDFIAAVNAKLDRPRLLHGAQAQYAGIRGPCTAFLPDGTVIPLETDDDVRLFYELIERLTRADAVPQPPGAVIDELAAFRAERAARAGR